MARKARQDARVSFGCLYNAGCGSWLLLSKQQFPFLKQIRKWVGFIVSGRGRTPQRNQPNQSTFPPQPTARSLGEELPPACSRKVRGALPAVGLEYMVGTDLPSQGSVTPGSGLAPACQWARVRLPMLPEADRPAVRGSAAWWDAGLLPGRMRVPCQIGIPQSCPGHRGVIGLLALGIASDVVCWVRLEGGGQYCKALCFVAA